MNSVGRPSLKVNSRYRHLQKNQLASAQSGANWFFLIVTFIAVTALFLILFFVGIFIFDMKLQLASI